MSKFTLFSRFLLVINLLLLACVQANAQITPDSTLGKQRSIVQPNQTIKNFPSDRIEGGVRRGASLFHSFGQFNIDGGKAVYFTSPVGVKNILSRVTGDSRSTISGRLGVLGKANLFLINPNGITFGPNASLDVNSSFLPTTASSVILPNNTEFSATNPQPVPLLTVDVPVGLNFTQNPGSIEVQGPGHNLINPGSPYTSIVQSSGGPTPNGLALQPGHTLAFVGGSVVFTGGIATAPSGRIEIGSVDSGQVLIDLNPSEGIILSYPEIKDLQNVLIEKSSLLNASGYQNGNIQIFANNVELTDSSVVLVTSQGPGSLGSINVNTSGSLIITGITKFSKILSGNQSSSNGINSITLNGKGSDINISTERLVLKDAAGIASQAFGSGKGGNIEIKASESTQVLGNSPLNPLFQSGSYISAPTVGTKRSGDIDLTTKELSIQDGGIVSSSTIGKGEAGDVRITAFDSIDIAGYNPSFFPSIISSITFSSGQGGNVEINTKELTLQNGGRVDASTIASGSAGNLKINAPNSISVSGTVPGSLNPSLIIASANIVDPSVRETLGLPDAPTGSSGKLAIDTGELSVTDGAQVTVRNDGSGNAGDLEINADSISLSNQGGITASTASGKGGDVRLSVDGLSLLQNGSSISASAKGQGDGGNITIDTQLLAVLGGSTISANAEQGSGGRVTITTQRPFVSPDSAITATSDKGPQFDGVVRLNVSQLEFSRSTAQTVSGPQTPEIATACNDGIATKEASLINAGPGGLPPSPLESLNPEAEWRGRQPQRTQTTPQPVDQAELDEMPEVQGWLPNGDGTVRLVARMPQSVPQTPASISACR